MSISEELHRLLFVGDRITNKDLKALLQKLYDKHQIKAKAQAAHIKLFGFKVKRVAIAKRDKRIEGLQIIN